MVMTVTKVLGVLGAGVVLVGAGLLIHRLYRTAAPTPEQHKDEKHNNKTPSPRCLCATPRTVCTSCSMCNGTMVYHLNECSVPGHAPANCVLFQRPVCSNCLETHKADMNSNTTNTNTNSVII
jgi:hypothetical protein